MVNRNLAQALVMIFVITTIVAALVTVYAYQQPVEGVETTTIATYSQSGTYSYLAELFPNIIYNTTIVGPGEGKLYEPILSYVNITFDYAFSGTPAPTNLSVTHYVQVEIASQKWTKSLTAEEAMDWLGLNTSEMAFSIFLNASSMNDIFKTIDVETSSTSSQYNITVTPHIFQRATISGENVYEVFSPQLDIVFRQDQGRFIDITPLSTVNQGSITDTVTVRNAWVDSLRLAAVAGIVISGIALVAALALYYRSKPSELRRSVEKMISPHKDIIVDTAQIPPATNSIVETTSLDDLVRTAEVLARPIMHSVAGNEHTFFILDGETKYQFKILS
jgi:hypothetical protein